MTTHVAILLRRYIRLVLAGSKTVESRLTRTRKAPLDCVSVGDTIHFKASAGPYMATAVVAKVETHRDLTPAKVEALRRKHHKAVGGDAAYWRAKREARYATFITLRDVKATSAGPVMPPSNGVAWFVVGPEGAPQANPKVSGKKDGQLKLSILGSNKRASQEHASKDLLRDADLQPFDLPLTRAAFTTRVVRIPRATDHFPADAFGDARRPGKPIELLLPDGEVVRTDLIAGDGRFRWRGWARPFLAARLAVGDRLRFEPVDLRRWRVIFVRAADLPESPAPPESPSPGNPGASTMPAKTRSSDAAPRLADFASDADVARLIRVAREEDLGPRLDDITSRLFVPADRATVAVMRSRQKGRLSGAALLPAIAKLYDPAIALDLRGVDGQALEPGSIVAEFRGPLRSILAMERVALNFVTHLSGIASLTRQFVDVVGDAKAGVYDTRKTIPGLRGLAKYAVVCGGGHSHRMGLHDAVLVKDNHLAHLALADLPAALGAGIAQARRESPKPAFVEIEVDTLAQLEKVLPLGPDLVLLDNMTLEQLRSAVALRDRVAPKVELEASGGVRLETIRAIALTGVDRIAIGALTHSAPSLDLGLDIDA